MVFEQEGIRLFDQLQIRYYGLIIVAAMLVAAWMAARLAKRDGKDPEHIWGALTWAIIPGIILARLWFVFFPPVSLTAGCATDVTTDLCRDTAWFFQNISNLTDGPLAIWSGGLSIFGAVIGGLLGAWLYLGPWHNRVTAFINRIWWLLVGGLGVILVAIGAANALPVLIAIGGVVLVLLVLWLIPVTRKFMERIFGGGQTAAFPAEGLPVAQWLDIGAVVLPLGQAIGRWANWVNQELYGAVTNLPWGLTIESAKRVAPYGSTIDFPVDATRFHPLFLYESLWSILAFIVLLNLFLRFRHRLFPGDILLIYVMQYSVIRFLLEFLRVDVTLLGGINLSQAVSVVAFLVALGFFLYRHRPGHAPAAPQPST